MIIKRISVVLLTALVITMCYANFFATPINNVSRDLHDNSVSDSASNIEPVKQKSVSIDRINPSVIAVVAKMSFSEAIDLSDCVVIGEYVSSHETDWGGIDYEFRVKDTLRGNVPEEIIHVVSFKGIAYVEGESYTYELGGDFYENGREYILVLGRNDSLFLEYPQFATLCGIVIPIEDIGKSNMYGEKLSDVADNSLEEIKSLIREARLAKQKQKWYTDATDYSTIVNESRFVMKVRITGLSSEGITANSNIYLFEPIEVLKGDLPINEINKDYYSIALMKGSVLVGKSYIVMVNWSDGEDSYMLMQSSLRSVVDTGDETTVNEIYQLC